MLVKIPCDDAVASQDGMPTPKLKPINWVKCTAPVNIKVYVENVTDFETDLFNAVIAEKKMSHFALDGIWIPIDTPKDLETINYIKSSNEKYKTLVEKLGISF